MNLKNILLQFHIYLGLFCSPYLILFGISSLSFNHINLKEKFTPIDSTHLEYTFQKVDFNTPRDLGEAIGDSLQLMGWFIPWESSIDSAGFYINMRHMGRDYRFIGQWDHSPITMITNYTRKISMIKGLHGLGGDIPRAPWWINAWQYYQDLTVYALLFWALSGVILWTKNTTKKKSELFWLFGSSLFSILLMIYLWLIG